MGAVCDNFLTKNQQLLDEIQWEQLKASWNQSGWAVECTTSDTVGNLKKEIELLCSNQKCDYSTQQAIVGVLNRVITTGKRALSSPKASANIDR